jgi:hypothetical protein
MQSYWTPSQMTLEQSLLLTIADGLSPRKATSTYQRFQRTYEHDLLAFVHDCIDFADDEVLASYQEEILGNFIANRRTAVRSCHGAGKTALAAWVVLWGVLTANDVKVPTTASAWRQLTKFLWPEVHKWAERLRWHKIGRDPFTGRELMSRNLRLSSTCEAFAVASHNYHLIEGAHANRIVYVFDEAKAIPDETWDAAEGAFASGECYALAISTPGPPAGRFYDIHKRATGYEDWQTRHITLDEACGAGRVNAEWAEQRRRQWRPESAVYQNRVLGEFAASDEDSIIPLSWVELATDRWHMLADAGQLELDRTSVVGVDVARGGGDLTVMALGDGEVVLELRQYDYASTMPTAGHVKGIMDRYKARAVIDVIGIGAGVVDRLVELGYPRDRVMPFNAGERTSLTDRSGELGFVNKRAASWWLVREMLDPDSGVPVALPDDDQLIGELTTPKWGNNSSGRITVEGKDQVRKRLSGRSTDNADAVIMALTWRQIRGAPGIYMGLL